MEATGLSCLMSCLECGPVHRRLSRVSLLKRRYGWRRSRLRGYERVDTWVGWGAITHNLTKYARLQLA